MGLILREVLYAIDVSIENASRIFIWVPKEVLSQPYNLPQFSKLRGEILEVAPHPEPVVSHDDKAILEELKGKPIEFIFFGKPTGRDVLFLSSETWPILRDYGILPEHYEIMVRIDEARFDDKIVRIYPRRDVQID